MKFSQMTQRIGNRFKQRLVPFVNGVYGLYAKMRIAVGRSIVIDDASDEPLTSLRVFGKSTQNGTPTPASPVKIVSVTSPKVNVAGQTLSIPYTLHGVPVTTGGNYTDDNGQQWICDEVDFERGVYVQRVGKTDLRTAGWLQLPDNSYQTYLDSGHYTPTNNIVCSHLNGGTEIYINNEQRISVNYDISTADELKSILNEAFVIAPLETPIEKPLTAEQIEAYKSLHTNEPNTTITNDQNAWMEVGYIKN